MTAVLSLAAKATGSGASLQLTFTLSVPCLSVEQRMSVTSDFQKEAARLRASARRARRMATQLTIDEDRQRLELYAQELERHAADLERRDSHEKPAPKE